MVHGLSVVWLPVRDVRRAVDFYQGVLDLEIVKQQDEWAELKSEGVRIGLNGHQDQIHIGDGGAVLAFHADGGIEPTVDELHRRGATFRGEIIDYPWGRVATFEDPDGNELQLYEPPSS
jgi:predicted enzyme related to lactoylglutathione lyase